MIIRTKLVDRYLEELAKKIQEIENKNPDYVHNEQWNKLRQFQDKCYLKLAKQQIVEIDFKLSCERNESKIRMLRDRQSQLKEYLKEQEYEQSN